MPADLWSVVGRRELTRALGTSDARKALPQALQFAGLAKRAFEEIRTVNGSGGKRVGEPQTDGIEPQPDGMSPDQVTELMKYVLEVKHMQTEHDMAVRTRRLNSSFAAERETLVRNHRDTLAHLLLAKPTAPAVERADVSAAEAIEVPTPTIGKASKPVLLSELIEGWAAEVKPEDKTVKDWGRLIRKFQDFVGHDDAARITEEDVVNWKDSLVASGLKAATINNKHLAALRAALGYGKKNKRLASNVGLGVSVRAARGSKVKMRGYTDEEARKVLTAARALHGWKRWLVFVAAYTGTRISEPADAMADDVKIEHGIPFIDLTGRILKNDPSQRRIPLHPALIEEGFLDYAQALPRGGPLFPDLAPAKTYNRRGDAASKIISRWVRNDLKITDERIQPNHAWRHRMATEHRKAQIPRDVSRYLRGYAPETDGDHYGETDHLPMLAEYMAKVPPMA